MSERRPIKFRAKRIDTGEWDDRLNGAFIGDTLLGQYCVMWSNTNNGYVVAKPNKPYLPPAFDALDDAKAYAEQDYLARITTALEKVETHG